MYNGDSWHKKSGADFWGYSCRRNMVRSRGMWIRRMEMLTSSCVAIVLKIRREI